MNTPIYSNPGASHAQDYQAVDGLQTIQYLSTGANGQQNQTLVQIAYADPHELTIQEVVALGGLFREGDRRWFLGHDQFKAAGIHPQQGDIITDTQGIQWTITGQAMLDDQGVSWLVYTTKAR